MTGAPVLALAWVTSKDGPSSSTYYATTLPDGRVVRVRATGQRNGRVLGGAWAATIGWPGVTIAKSSTLTGCKAQVLAYAIEQAAR